jgi:hypothetical protein
VRSGLDGRVIELGFRDELRYECEGWIFPRSYLPSFQLNLQLSYNLTSFATSSSLLTNDEITNMF